MANQYIVPRPPGFYRDAPALRLLPDAQQHLLFSRCKNLKDAMFPEKLPPLRLTSRPLPVREIWSRRNNRRAATGSLTLHALAIGGLIAFTILASRAPVTEQPKEQVTLIAP